MCKECNAEIEFGWEFPNEWGRIFPVASSAFLPGKVWPDKKYLNAWIEKGWVERVMHYPVGVWHQSAGVGKPKSVPVPGLAE